MKEESCMKKFYLFIVLFAYAIAARASDDPAKSWVMCSDGRLEAKKISITETKIVLLMDNGTKKIIPLENVDSYSIDGKVLKKLPVYINGKPNGKSVFMELVKVQENLKLYRYSYWNYPDKKIMNFQLYDGELLLLEYDEKSCIF
jgi:hypothetical protein